jgi:PHD/YefM family antitoxin component YafN of YafNO toxin-antitoxin module
MAQILPSSDLRNHYPKVAALAKKSQEAVFLTVNGRGDCVLLSMDAYNKLTDELELLRGIARAEQDIQTGKSEEAKKVFQELIDRYETKNTKG